MSPLSNKERAFLSENYRVLNPATGKMSSDFDPVLICPIVLVGQYHFTRRAPIVERELLQLFKEKTCLLLESLKPSASVDKRELTIYTGIPDQIELRGSDIRDTRSTQEYVAFENLQHQLDVACHAHKVAMERKATTIFKFINNAFASGQISIANETLYAEPDVYKALLTLWITKGETDDLAKETHLLQTRLRALNRLNSDSEEYRIDESNEFLIREIKKVESQYKKIIAIWGCHHYNGEAFNQALGIPGVDFIVLVPSPKLEEECNAETLYSKGSTPLTRMRVINRTNAAEFTMRIPTQFFTFLNPALYDPRILSTLERKQFFLDESTIRTLFEHQDTYTSETGTDLVFKHFDRELHNSMNDKINQSVIEQKAIERGIQKILAFCNLSLVGLKLEGVEYTYTDYMPSLTLWSKKSVQLIVNRNVIQIRASDLFEEMKRRNMTAFTWNDGTTLILEKIGPKVLNIISRDPNALSAWLSFYAPSGMKVVSTGSITLSDATANNVSALGLTSNGKAALRLIATNNEK